MVRSAAQRVSEDAPEPIALPVPAPDPQPGRVLGATGAAVQLAGREYHLAVFTAVGMRSLNEYLNEQNRFPAIPLPGATLGEQVAEGVIVSGKFDEFEEFLRRVIAEEVPPGLAEELMAEEIAACVETVLSQSGLRWLERLLKNRLAEVGPQIEQQLLTQALAAAETTTAANAST